MIFVFSGKVIVFVQAHSIFRGLSFDFFLVPVVKTKSNSTIEQLKCKCHEKRDRLLVSKVQSIFRFLSEIKV